MRVCVCLGCRLLVTTLCVGLAMHMKCQNDNVCISFLVCVTIVVNSAKEVMFSLAFVCLFVSSFSKNSPLIITKFGERVEYGPLDFGNPSHVALGLESG